MAAQDQDRNWTDLPRDVLHLIFKKLGVIHVLDPAELVCRHWKRAALDPDLWRCLDLRNLCECCYHHIDVESVTLEIVDRAAGRLEEFYCEHFVSDDILRYIADRTSSLTRLHLISCDEVSKEGLREIIRKSPLLEELEITFCSVGDDVYHYIGTECPQLKRLQANTKCFKFTNGWFGFDFDREALGIAENLHELRELQMLGNQVTNKGLLAILDQCPHLHSLDIRGCYNIKMDKNMRSRLETIANVRLPNDLGYDYESKIAENDREDRMLSLIHSAEMAMLHDHLCNGNDDDGDDGDDDED